MDKCIIDLEGKRILVTGAAGFIGAGLCLRLLKECADITIIEVDDLNDYYDISLKKWRLSQIQELFGKNGNEFIFHQKNIADKGSIEDIFYIHRPKIVVNLAAQAGVRAVFHNGSRCVHRK